MFKDFSVYTYNNGVMGPDPYISFVRDGIELVSPGVGDPWTRYRLTATPDRDAKFLVLGARVQSPAMDASNAEHLTSQHFTNWALERALSTQLPTAPYVSAREIQVVVKPDRLNLFPNPSWETNTTYGVATQSGCTATRTTSLAYLGTACLQLVSNSGGEIYVRNTTAVAQRMSVSPGKTYTASYYSRAGSTPRNVQARIHWTNVSSASLGTVVGASVTNNTTDWVRPFATGVAPVGADHATISILTTTTAAAEVHYADAVMFEEVEEPGEYFDGSYGEDYMWDGTAHNSRSYYYKDRIDRAEVIPRALRDAVPLGIGVAAPKFGVFTG